jgi:hypothetical protein
VQLPVPAVAPETYGLVVDEGPGLSGSSMAAAAAALAGAGVERGRISFFPGHGGDPGSAASDTVRAWWASSRRYVGPLAALRWGGRSLEGVLAERTQRNLGERVVEVEPIGAAVGGDTCMLARANGPPPSRRSSGRSTDA